MKLLMVSVGESRYAVPADIVTQILDPALEGDLRVERSEAVYRGERLPVLDLHAVAGEPHGVARVYLVVEAARSRAIVAVGGAEAALPLGIVREVAARPAITRVPGSHSFVTGIALHGGVALPVYDLVRFAPLWSGPRPV